MDLPNPARAHSLAVSAASMSRIAASVMGGGISEDTNTRLALALAESNVGHFADAYATIDKLADEQKAWIPCMMILRLAQATFGNEAGPAGEAAPCVSCGSNMLPVFAGARICLACRWGPGPTTVSRVRQP